MTRNYYIKKVQKRCANTLAHHSESILGALKLQSLTKGQLQAISYILLVTTLKGVSDEKQSN